MDQQSLDNLCINTIRMLAVDAVEKAQSGHPGTPMEAAAMAYELWTDIMRYNPTNPHWPNRDRFILSAGHASMLLYAMLHLTGYDLSLDQIRQFRQWGSQTPGHPEYHHTPGVETTTGPLGQGFAAGVGMAVAERYLADLFNRPDYEVVDYRIYAYCSDGDMMEGVSSEAASFAGHHRLNRLIYIYGDNRITIDGETNLTFSESVGKRFEAYNWFVQNIDGNDRPAFRLAIEQAQQQEERPSLIIARTHIGFGSPGKQDKAVAHGAPLGADEVKKTKENLGWPLEPAFYIPQEVLQHFRKAIDRGKKLEQDWSQKFNAYSDRYRDQAELWRRISEGKLPDGWEKSIPDLSKEKPIATRAASGKVLTSLAKAIPNLVAGSADLAESTNTHLKDLGSFGKDRGGRNIHFGVREHCMGGVLNGIALSEMLIPVGGTFFIFTDYMRPAMRIAALMKANTIYGLTHDSIGLGEDGPTHQPVEHLASFRAMPNMTVLRPGDATETAVAWEIALTRRKGPVCLVLTRQKLPVIDRSKFAPAENAKKGGYIVADAPDSQPQIILMATGSELSVILSAHEKLATEGIKTRVVSMICWEIFNEQPDDYKKQVLPPNVRARVAVEAASPFGWSQYVGEEGIVIGMTTFGASAPAEVNMEKFGFTPENVIAKAKALLRPPAVHNR
jgi:transketolase